MGIKIWIVFMKIGNILGCHQRPDRSFFICGYQFPICMRCTGILLGCITALIFYSYLVEECWKFVLLCIPMAIDGGAQFLKLWKSTNWSRVLTGYLAGIGSMTIEIKMILKIVSK